MISTEDYYRLIVNTVPQWYIAMGQAPHDFNVNFCGDSYWISSNRNPTPQLHRWKDKCLSIAAELLSKPTTGSKIIDKDLIQSRFVKEWLLEKGYKGDWEEIFDYSRSLESRTYENASIGFTYIYDSNRNGTLSLFEDNNQKIIDVLAETQYTYFRVGNGWTFIDYDYVKWNEIVIKEDYKLIPEFLYPYQSILEEGECGITKTKRGDLIIYNKNGLLASSRKGEWKIYDSPSLKNSLVDYVGVSNYRVGCNLFEILFDLSYRRHGALIIIDNQGTYKEIISNHSSLIENGSTLHQVLSERLEKIDLSSARSDVVSKQLILELASVDGALVLNETGKVLAFGAIVNSHEHADGETGARSTAALSAHLYGSKVLKVSSDGEITLYYLNQQGSQDPELIKLRFL
ncbi:DNA integrity scanning protein DisA nucleotide-binding domain protein [Paenisporosarcina sp. FSL H8-0542]|uniref:DNA integrity scanning protein DisA nucleotide-binding domain protein n=1 Tax=Paenisporosarcina sp. FSL H8-0542 TaxID=2921401 RepID=UPI00315A31F0